ncbi:hypothetical protein [Chryseosolibacter indicus]|uniref:Protein SirB1 N-terminal domain-containing protein n=1 Tax=Chryseosolibacter indicus TaxID=2782351 RepID=A0ABS5VNL9_9BACT|nr:hypothetical protein [Chryseosolibacter indicus]MBT1703047.1 hypothetical protein [Chryseosolibacter indicus]
MRVKVLFLLVPILFLRGTYASAQVDRGISYYVNLFSETDNTSSSLDDDLKKFVQQLARKRNSKSEKQFLEYLFSKTHRRYLKNYTEYASFGELAENGTYNCLTGTALYALLLDHFNIEHKIIETNYHIFLLVKTNDGAVLFEATDPAHGYVSDEREMVRRISFYKENRIEQKEKDNEKTLYQYQFKLFNTVSLKQMAGLLHYNMAIEAYNAQELTGAINHLDKAIAVYNSPRIEEFSKIVLLSVMQSELDASTKEEYVKKIQLLRKQRIPAIASSSFLAD